MKVTAVIFDMDGTVLNTLEDLTDAVNAMRRHFDLEPHSIEQVRHNVGNGVEVLMEKSLPGGRDDPRFDEALAFYRAYYESHNQIKTAPYPGILPLMDELKKRGVAMAVVSNKQDAAVKPLSRHFFGDRMALSMGPGGVSLCGRLGGGRYDGQERGTDLRRRHLGLSGAESSGKPQPGLYHRPAGGAAQAPIKSSAEMVPV